MPGMEAKSPPTYWSEGSCCRGSTKKARTVPDPSDRSIERDTYDGRHVARATVTRPIQEVDGSVTTPGKLSYQVFISDPIPFSDTERAPNGDRRMFQPISSTLIVGATDAVLVDPPMTTAQTERVATWIQESAKRLKPTYIPHGHGDH